MAQATAQIGVTGLAVMGRNLARNFARHGYTRRPAQPDRLPDARAWSSSSATRANFVPAETAEEFVRPSSGRAA